LPATTSTRSGLDPLHDLGKIEEDTAELGMAADELDQHPTGPAADVHDGLVVPREVRDSSDARRRTGGHRAVEDRELVGMRAHPGLEVRSEDERKRRLARRDRVREARERLVPFGAELEGEFVPGLIAVRPQQLRCGGIAEEARLDFLEHAVRGESAEDAVDGVHVRVACELLDAARPGGEGVGDA